ncbi:hypothetical protein CEUSTIGMA_g1949.t1 [Chlamydomonas eustigma]|uniref:Peptidase S1 domain-containing protein n=1 Tax=Chlamydomonas eustigma TaxID=1157962 RepID=A0A250WVD9_9CHLO|nr:hypothetical protein CEUSTIGMA_g1949.t1 [Chlamydomonas eustigma]|eukprot:GAX74500.1 hypothetical protein CEUSTIGMA_g1949.t1 [Chlamydomonas eustigma]
MGIHSPDCTVDTIPVSSPVTSFANQPSYGVLPSPIIISPPVSTYSTKPDSTPVAAADAISSIHLQLTGYPDTWPQGSCATEQCTTHIPQCMDPLLMHDCATSPGQSGSPMWRMEASSLNCTAWGAYIYAVHNAELENVTSTSETPISNCAVYITPLHFMSILSWIQESFNILEQAMDAPMVPPGSPVAESDGASRRKPIKGSPSFSSSKRFEAVVAGCALFPVHMVNASFQPQPLPASSSCPQPLSLLLILQLPMFAVLLMYYTVSDW